MVSLYTFHFITSVGFLSQCELSFSFFRPSTCNDGLENGLFGSVSLFCAFSNEIGEGKKIAENLLKEIW